MVSQLIVGENTYVTRDEADAYLEDSLRATPWASVDPDTKDRALISAFRLLEKQRWNGTATGVSIVATVVLASGGTGYAVDEILTVVGGTFGEAARIKVTAVSGGVITGFQLVDAGTYSSADTPTSPVSTTGGGNDDATFTLTFKDQEALHPRTGLTDCDGVAVDELTVAQQLEDAQVELAFELTQDTTLENKKNQGSNIKGVGAGSARVDFFRASNKAGESTRFPAIVQELIRCFLGGPATTNGAKSFGTGEASQFDDCDRYDIRDGSGFP